ncbi:MAG TPA: hypothetical protein VIC55_05060 [Gemmatimonadaceae bacterium]|jgi:hypothetical protein
MSKPWRDHDWQDEDTPNDQQWSAELSFGDPDAWRSTDAGLVNETWGDDDTAAVDGWPEWDAGPEYRMWKRLADGER